ncbi:hypothetical protein ABZ234_18600 [Nocardiopsis sp. NPDC006198]|uniref:hypothetical protein n=1 Tax=Nocardiopsis sp. NPDC006198 TaxID=3154472 RepID=UPI0033A83B6E
MTESWRSRAKRRHGEKINDRLNGLLEEPPLTSDEIETQRRLNLLDSMQSMDPTATLEEELTIRLSGESAKGALEVGDSDNLLRPIREIIRGSSSSDVELELFGVSSGSTVLHLRPKKTSPAFDDTRDEVYLNFETTDSVDFAVREMIKFVDATEEGDGISRWAKKDSTIEGMERFVEALDKRDLEAQFTWSATDGTVRSSRLTRRGRENMAKIGQTRATSREEIVRGYVSEIIISETSGKVKIKKSLRKNAPAVLISFSESELRSTPLQIGQEAEFVIRITEHRDQIGRIAKTEVHFSRLSEEHPALGEM